MRQLARGVVAIVGAALVPLAAVAPDAPLGPIVINEVSWAGAGWDLTAEWIELFNPSDEPIDLDGWRLISSDGSPYVELRGTIPPHTGGDPASGFFLLEREHDGCVPGIEADQIYCCALTDRGEALYLFDPQGGLADSANATDDPTAPWPAGTEARGTPPYASMERIDYRQADGPANWATSSAETSSGPEGRPIHGTPGHENSAFNMPPTLMFSIVPPYPTPGDFVDFDASTSFDKNDRIASYRWDFGDGTEGVGPTATHTFIESGDYCVTLVATDEKGGASLLTRIVRVQPTSPPIPDFSIVTQPPGLKPRAGTPIRLQDESSDPGGEIVGWEWAFGDGDTASDAAPLHTYDEHGTYLVVLRVVDDRGDAAVQSRSYTVASRLPVATFSRSLDLPSEADPIEFDASASYDPDGVIELYRWDFDSNGTIDQETPDPVIKFAFAERGDYGVRLSVVDDAGDVSIPFVEPLSVNGLPIAEFQLSAFEASELEPILFTDLSHDVDGEIVGLLWDFGDGTTIKTAAESEHVFEDDGTYTVSLTVMDNAGARHTTSAEVRIANLPPTALLTPA